MKRLLVKHEGILNLDFDLKSQGLLTNWLNEYRKLLYISIYQRE